MSSSLRSEEPTLLSTLYPALYHLIGKSLKDLKHLSRLMIFKKNSKVFKTASVSKFKIQ